MVILEITEYKKKTVSSPNIPVWKNFHQSYSEEVWPPEESEHSGCRTLSSTAMCVSNASMAVLLCDLSLGFQAWSRENQADTNRANPAIC